MSNDSDTPARAPLKAVVALCVIVDGLQINEGISNNVLPLTLHRFAIQASLIGLILSVHPLFGLGPIGFWPTNCVLSIRGTWMSCGAKSRKTGPA